MNPRTCRRCPKKTHRDASAGGQFHDPMGTPVEFLWRRPVERTMCVSASIWAEGNKEKQSEQTVLHHGSTAMPRKKKGKGEVPRRGTICNGLKSSLVCTEQRCQAILQKSPKSSRMSARYLSPSNGKARQKCVASVPVKMQAKLPRSMAVVDKYGICLFYPCTFKAKSAHDSAEARDCRGMSDQ